MEKSKRKPLADITNTYNLIPTTALRKLVAASSTSKSVSRPPNSISKSISSSTNRKFFSESSSRSNTSIGSSTVGATLNSKKTVQFRSPQPSISSITSPVKQRDIGKDVAGNSSCSLEKTNDRKEGILKHSRSSTVKIKERGQEYLNPSSFFGERAEEKGKPLNTSNSSLEKMGGKGKAILQLSSNVEIIERGKYKGTSLNILNSPHEKKRGKGKAILQSSDIVEIIELAKDKGKLLNTSNSSHEKMWEKGKTILQPSDIVEIVEREKDKRKSLNTFSTSYEKTKGKRITNLQHSHPVEVSENKWSSDAMAVKSRPPRRKSEKRKFDAGASSCPAKMMSKSIQNDLDEAGDSKSSKSWTDLHSKRKKKTCSRTENTCELPPDFIEMQKAYFKEVDAFELIEEEATPDELD